MNGSKISAHPIHLGLGAKATSEPEFTGSMDWYVDYGVRHQSEHVEGRLVSTHTFLEPWTMWEMHPNGCEVVLCTAGKMTLHQETADGSKRSIQLGPGEYAINEAGTWHTADVDDSATALFITAGFGTQHRSR
jgi:quercetin dioxygenase-like cupin family protein